MDKIISIARKEFAVFFASPAAFIFIGAFLAVSLFVFFWVETFFSRNIADVRPLFEWMPVLMIFLVAALTMRLWSEERRAGTLEFLLTAPISPLQYVLGKFLACLALVAVALALTLALPLSVALLGDLDWGPVLGGYVAALFLAAAYIAVGLFVSARSDNQIVSLILTVLICGVFYLLGADALTGLFGNRAGEWLALLGSGSRFESITRGVIDLRDLYYYLSIVGVFLTLNVLALERLRWAGNATRPAHRQGQALALLFIANFVAANVWLQHVGWARADITAGKIYSISDATRGYLAQLQEPLVIRGYFSAKTHPLLAPLEPQLRDLLEEYAVAGNGRVRVEFVDPMDDPELEREAGEKYGIRPVPFQTTSKYQAAIVNSYFDLLVQYGDEYEVLGFRDLIEVKAQSETEVDVQLRNPEYEITRSIKKVLYSYRGGGNLFASVTSPVAFRGYISEAARLPEPLVELRQALDEVLADLKADGGEKFTAEIADPDAAGGGLARRISDEYGFRPMAAGLFDPNTFWFYMTLESQGQMVQVPLPEDLSQTALARSVEGALKRFSSGFLKTVALYTPPGSPPMPQFGMPGDGKRYTMVEDALRETTALQTTPLDQGHVPESADVLVVASPTELDDRQLFAIDQFLMKGGTVVMATSPLEITLQGMVGASQHTSGVEQWLAHHGIELAQAMVLDPQNSAFPIPMERNLGGFIVREVQMVDYPYFVDVRDAGMNRDVAITAGVPQVTMNWASPVTVDPAKNETRRVIPVLESSEESWTSETLDIQPDYARYPEFGFARSGEQGKQLLAVAVEGRFDSYFKDKASPLLENRSDEEPAAEGGADPAGDEAPVITNIIDKSPESARIILFASNTFLTDNAIDLASSSAGTLYLNQVQLLENTIDWSLEEQGLLSIRGRGHFARTLPSLDKETQMIWEYGNYGFALLGLLVVFGLYRVSRQRAQRDYRRMLSEQGV